MRVNKAELIGNVGKDPEVRLMGNTDRKVANFSLATTEVYRDKQGEKQESTDWHRCVAYGKTAEVVEKYVKKGTKIAVEGRIKYRTYEKDGETKYITEIEVSSLLLLSSKKDGGSASGPEPSGPDEADDLPF